MSYYDDSGACSNEATWFSFDNIRETVVWITYADNFDCDDLIPQVKRYVKAIICIGNNTDRFNNVFGNIVDGKIFGCQSIEEAVKLSYGMTEAGDNVLFSPATPVKGDFMSDQHATGDQWRNNSRKNGDTSQSKNNTQLWM